MGEFLQSNHSPTMDESRISWFSRRDLVLIIIGGTVSASLGLLLASPIGSSYDFAPLIFSANTVSMVFATGLFFFLTAGLLLGSRSSHLYLLCKIKEIGTRKAFLIRILHILVFTTSFTIIFTVVVFLYPVILAAMAYYPVSFNHFSFFPAVLGASLIGSVLLALIASSLAILTDDSRLCTILGCVSTLLIAFLGGWNTVSNPWTYSLTRNLAFLSPHNMVRALAIVLSGYQFENANRMIEFVGFAFSTESLAIAFFLLGIISIMLVIVGQKVMIRNSKRWIALGGITPSQEIWSTAVPTEKGLLTNRIKRGLRIQRGLTTLVIGALLVSMMAGVSMYTTYLSNSTLFIHYVSPGDKEMISVGKWNIYGVDVQPPYPGLFNGLYFYCFIETWGNASDSLSFYFGIVAMNSTEFNSIDEEGRLALLPGYRLNQTWDGGGGFGLGDNLGESYGSYICVLLIIADANPMENSYIETSLLIIQNGL
ncbi:MAG: hypothetical protein OEV85_07810 [Candidatus Thorarchaeota archaeon]|nr:hypothetical protein [Candidatus Thorarchaeota archaeon]